MTDFMQPANELVSQPTQPASDSASQPISQPVTGSENHAVMLKEKQGHAQVAVKPVVNWVRYYRIVSGYLSDYRPVVSP